MFPNKHFYSDKELASSYNKFQEDRPKINDEIKAFKIRLIDEGGNNVGIINTKDAVLKAKSVSLDLVEVMPNNEVPVCKIMDIGKYMFEKRKKQKENCHNKSPESREIRLSTRITQHDLEIKSQKIKEFIVEGSKVLLQFKLHGRESKHPELIASVVNNLSLLIGSFAIIENKAGTYIVHKKQ